MQRSKSVFQPLTWFFWPMQLAARTLAHLDAAPDVLTQAINPWSAVININSNNSSAPATELAVLRRYSYGRQLGRLNEVVALLIRRLESPRRTLDDAERAIVRDFESMKAEVDALKAESTQARVDRLVAEVERLSQSDPTHFDALIRRLQRVVSARQLT